VVFYKVNDELMHYIILDDMNAMVYEIQKHIMAKIKSKLPNILKVECYSDGCAGQYKNYKIFLQFVPAQNRFWHRSQMGIFLPQVMESSVVVV